MQRVRKKRYIYLFVLITVEQTGSGMQYQSVHAIPVCAHWADVLCPKSCQWKSDVAGVNTGLISLLQ